jgi:hypothetical protein
MPVAIRPIWRPTGTPAADWNSTSIEGRWPLTGGLSESRHPRPGRMADQRQRAGCPGRSRPGRGAPGPLPLGLLDRRALLLQRLSRSAKTPVNCPGMCWDDRIGGMVGPGSGRSGWSRLWARRDADDQARKRQPMVPEAEGKSLPEVAPSEVRHAGAGRRLRRDGRCGRGDAGAVAT